MTSSGSWAIILRLRCRVVDDFGSRWADNGCCPLQLSVTYQLGPVSVRLQPPFQHELWFTLPKDSNDIFVQTGEVNRFDVRDETVLVLVFSDLRLCSLPFSYLKTPLSRLNRKGTPSGFFTFVLEANPRASALLCNQFNCRWEWPTFHIGQNRSVLLENFVGGLGKSKSSFVAPSSRHQRLSGVVLALSILSRDHLFDFCCSLFSHITPPAIHSYLPNLRLKTRSGIAFRLLLPVPFSSSRFVKRR
jgi:hypothetical protein